MMFTQEQLLTAVRKAGGNGQAFTCAAVRDCLGLSTRDKKQLNRFYAEFRAFQKAAPEVFEKVGKNAYRLTAITEAPEPEPVAEALPSEAVEDVGELVCVEIEIEPEPVAADDAAAVPHVAISVPAELGFTSRDSSELGFAESAPDLQCLELPLQLIEVELDGDPQQTAPVSETQRVEELIRKDAPQPPPLRGGWLGRSQWLGRRVAEFFGRS